MKHPEPAIAAHYTITHTDPEDRDILRAAGLTWSSERAAWGHREYSRVYRALQMLRAAREEKARPKPTPERPTTLTCSCALCDR